MDPKEASTHMFYLLRQFTLPKVIILTILVGLALLMFAPAQAQTPNPTSNHIGLVIVHGSGQAITRCVTFSENTINGYDLLARSGLDLNFEANGNGNAICRIDHEGCAYPQDNCFCQCAGGACSYWSYWLWSGAAWQYSNIGAANQIGHNGDVQGWRWGLGNVDGATPPPVMAFNDICKAELNAAVTPSPTTTPNATTTTSVTPSPTLTTRASPTATPTTTPATPQPTLSPTASPTLIPGAPTATMTLLPPTTTATATFPQSPLATPVVASAPTPVPAPGILTFSANPAVIDAGASTILTWRLANAETAVLRSNNGEEPLATGDNNFVGNKSITPGQTTVYTLVARSRGGEAATQVTITVNALVVTPVLPSSPPITAPLVAGQAQPISPLSLTNTLSATQLPATPTATFTPTLAPVRFDLTPTTLPITNNLTAAERAGEDQTQRLLLFGGVALAVIIPLGVAGLALLIWTIVRHL